MIEKRIATEEEKEAFNERIFNVCVSFNALCEEIGLIYGFRPDFIQDEFLFCCNNKTFNVHEFWERLDVSFDFCYSGAITDTTPNEDDYPY